MDFDIVHARKLGFDLTAKTAIQDDEDVHGPRAVASDGR